MKHFDIFEISKFDFLKIKLPKYFTKEIFKRQKYRNGFEITFLKKNKTEKKLQSLFASLINSVRQMNHCIITLLSDRNKILNNEQIDNGIILKSKPIMQKTLYFLKKMKWIIVHEFVAKFYNFTMKRFLRSIWG